ncbi:hypothetical protein Bca52824_021198 [Brassica carinata]|uniref:Uncharacterized protein n=1 Tax=Brassica carinata TaxID=52824 RepID=A0A8X7VUT7_BRACI|nr:hypothetical protein Bca52824_021198 [Brassica carinata]
MAIKIGGGGVPPGSASDTSVVYECLSPVIYRSIFGSYLYLSNFFKSGLLNDNLQILASCSCMALFSFRLEDCSTDDSLSVMFKDSTSWCHIAYAIPSVVEIRGYLCNMDAAWDAKSVPATLESSSRYCRLLKRPILAVLSILITHQAIEEWWISTGTFRYHV